MKNIKLKIELIDEDKDTLTNFSIRLAKALPV